MRAPVLRHFLDALYVAIVVALPGAIGNYSTSGEFLVKTPRTSITDRNWTLRALSSYHDYFAYSFVRILMLAALLL